MQQSLILLPAIALVFLTFGVLLLMAGRRLRAVKQKRINPRYFKTFQGYEVPEDLQAISRHYQNLLELPLLFYFIAGLLYMLQTVDIAYVLLAWGFVGLRILHSYIHLFRNNPLHRFYIFFVGFVVLLIMYGRFLWQLLMG